MVRLAISRWIFGESLFFLWEESILRLMLYVQVTDEIVPVQEGFFIGLILGGFLVVVGI